MIIDWGEGYRNLSKGVITGGLRYRLNKSYRNQGYYRDLGKGLKRDYLNRVLAQSYRNLGKGVIAEGSEGVEECGVAHVFRILDERRHVAGATRQRDRLDQSAKIKD